MGITEIIALALSLTNEIVKRTPTYDQQKLNYYYKVKKLYEEELKKPYEEQDDDVLLNLRDELLRWGRTFIEEISS